LSWSSLLRIDHAVAAHAFTVLSEREKRYAVSRK
jgi:hypothetical protein